MKTYSGAISTLAPNQVFVFGSNTQGRHGKGAALVAKQKFGAIYGRATGMQGRSYAICTKDLTKAVHPSVSTDSIMQQVDALYAFAQRYPKADFMVAYSGTGMNLNAYSPQEMAAMFKREHIPTNIIFEESFAALLS